MEVGSICVCICCSHCEERDDKNSEVYTLVGTSIHTCVWGCIGFFTSPTKMVGVAFSFQLFNLIISSSLLYVLYLI